MWSCLGYTRPALNRTGLWFGNSEIWRLVNLVCTVEEFLTKRIQFVSHDQIYQRARITKLDYLWPQFGSFMRSSITHPDQLLLFRGFLNKIPAMKGTQTFLLTHTADAEASKLPYKEWGNVFDFGKVDQTHSSCLHDVHVTDVLRNMRGILHFLIYVSMCNQH